MLHEVSYFESFDSGRARLHCIALLVSSLARSIASQPARDSSFEL